MIQGLDVSRYQNQPIMSSGGTIIGYKPLDYMRAYDQGIRWAAVRATIGNYYIDPCFDMNYRGYRDVGMPTYPYIVVAPRITDNGAKITAQQHWDKFLFAWDKLPDSYRLSKCKVILDCELTRGADRWEITALIEALVRIIAGTSCGTPTIYTRASWWNPNVLRSSKWKDNPLHVAHYGAIKPTLPLDWEDWYAWQYSADENTLGRQYGVYSIPVDLNHVKESELPPPPDDPPPDPEPDLASRVRVTIDDKPYKLVEDTEA